MALESFLQFVLSLLPNIICTKQPAAAKGTSKIILWNVLSSSVNSNSLIQISTCFKAFGIPTMDLNSVSCNFRCCPKKTKIRNFKMQFYIRFQYKKLKLKKKKLQIRKNLDLKFPELRYMYSFLGVGFMTLN